MQVALTGATGMLGGAVLDRLLADGHEVRALARNASSRDLTSADGLSWIDGSLEDLAALDAVIAGADSILHVAYCPVTDRPPAGRSIAEHFVRSNVMGTLSLLERTPATRHKQMVFVSSLAVYGPAPHLEEAAQRVPLDEDFPVWPREWYGAHKAALEKMVVAGSGHPDMNTAVFRIGCVLGAYRDRSRNPLAVPVDEATQHGEIRTTTGAYALLAEDAARVLVAALGNDTTRGGIYNTFHRWLDFSTLANPLADLLGRPVRVACDPAPTPAPALSNARLEVMQPRWHTDERLPALLADLIA